MKRFRHFMVALTKTEQDVSLLRYAAMAARLGDPNQISFVHIQGAASDGAKPSTHDQVVGELERFVQEHFQDAPENVELRFHVLDGPRIDGLLEFAAGQHVDLMLLGHKAGARPGRKALIRRLTMKAPCSVWIVPDGSEPRIGRVLAPVDFSDHSADALTVAADLTARAAAEECIALHVYHAVAVITYEEAIPIVCGMEEEAYERFIAPINLHGAKLRPMFVESERIAATVHQVAENEKVDLKVISTRGRSRSAAILLGSVTEGVIVEARTPVLIVKHFGAKLGLLETLLGRSFRRDAPHFN